MHDAGGSILATLALAAPAGVPDTKADGWHSIDLEASAAALLELLGASTAA